MIDETCEWGCRTGGHAGLRKEARRVRRTRCPSERGQQCRYPVPIAESLCRKVLFAQSGVAEGPRAQSHVAHLVEADCFRSQFTKLDTSPPKEGNRRFELASRLCRIERRNAVTTSGCDHLEQGVSRAFEDNKRSALVGPTVVDVDEKVRRQTSNGLALVGECQPLRACATTGG